jgi:hypothetical protein
MKGECRETMISHEGAYIQLIRGGRGYMEGCCLIESIGNLPI